MMDKETVVRNFVEIATLRRELKRGEMLNPLEDLGNIVYYIKHGALKICCELEGKEHILEFGLEGRFATNLLSFITGQRSKIYLQALRKTELVGIPRAYMSQLFSSRPEMLEGYTWILEQVLADRLRKEMILCLSSPADRIRELLALYPDIFQLVPQRHIAAYLDLAPETVSRQMNRHRC